MTHSSLESEYLISLLRSAIKQEKPKPAPNQLDWKRLVDISRSQQVYSIIVPVMDMRALPAEIASELRLYSQNELLRTIAMQNELEEIEKELEKNQVKYMLLKGCVIRNYYPLQKMRQMSDFDILYDKSKRSAVLSIMKGRKYSFISGSENSDDFTKKPFYTFEFHRDLFFDEHDFYFDFSYVWDNAVQDENKPYEYHMSREDLYLHSVAHMYKHYALGGFGIRFFADIYVMLKSFGDKLDWDYVHGMLKKMELLPFEKISREITMAVFDGEALDGEQKDFLNFVMSSGVYGSGQDGIKIYYDEYVKKHGESGAFSFFASKIFPDPQFMKRSYPVLESKPFLLPFYYLKRLFEKFVFKRKDIIKNVQILTQDQKEKKKK